MCIWTRGSVCEDDSVRRTNSPGLTASTRAQKRFTARDAVGVALLVAFVAMATILPSMSASKSVALYTPQTTAHASASAPAFGLADFTAGWDQVVPYGNTTCLNGTPVLDIKKANPTLKDVDIRRILFNWTFVENGENVSVIGAQPTHVWKYVGEYFVNLTATDQRTDEVARDTLIVKVIVKANAGQDRLFMEGNATASHVELNASLSASNYNITSYLWTWIYDGKDYVNTNVSFYFNFTKHGTYEIFLNVTDEAGNWAQDSVVVKVLRKPTFLTEHWLGLLVGVPAAIIAILWFVSKMRRDHALVTKTDIEKMRLKSKDLRKQWKIFRSNRLGFVGLIILFIFAS